MRALSCFSVAAGSAKASEPPRDASVSCQPCGEASGDAAGAGQPGGEASGAENCSAAQTGGAPAPQDAEEPALLGDPFYATSAWLEMPAPRMLVRLACLWEKVPAKTKLSTASWVQALRESRKQVRFTHSSGSAVDWLLEVREETLRKLPPAEKLNRQEWRSFAGPVLGGGAQRKARVEDCRRLVKEKLERFYDAAAA